MISSRRTSSTSKRFNFVNSAAQMLKSRVQTTVTEKDSPRRSPRRRQTFIRRNSHSQFQERNQTAIILDFDDTLFPSLFVEHESGLSKKNPADQQTHMREDDRQDALSKIEQCQASAESLLRCAQNFGQIILVTLSTRGRLKKLCETWYPRVWQLLNDDQVRIVYAIEPYRAELSKSSNSNFSASHWAWVKGRAIANELDLFYSQYPGQTWKNLISIGDSNFERYGTLGAASAYVHKRFHRQGESTDESSAYVQGWQRFDNDPNWSDSLEGVHEGHAFKVRTKVLKLMESPSPADLVQQLTLLSQWFPSIVGNDGCLNLCFDNLKEETVKTLESAFMTSPEVAKQSLIDKLDMPGVVPDLDALCKCLDLDPTGSEGEGSTTASSRTSAGKDEPDWQFEDGIPRCYSHPF